MKEINPGNSPIEPDLYQEEKTRLGLADRDGRLFANTPHGRKEVIFDYANFDAICGVYYTEDGVTYWHDTPWLHNNNVRPQDEKENQSPKLWSLTK